MSLRDRIGLVTMPKQWLNLAAAEYHYMHRPVHDRAHPFGFAVTFDGNQRMSEGKPAGFIMFASIHFTRMRGEFGYPGLPTKWQILSLARLWLHDDLPQNCATVVIGKCLRQSGNDRMALVQRRWLEVHPPRFPNEPYHILKIISYSDRTHGHVGTIYKAANFRDAGETISRSRHENTRGPGMDDHILDIWIYDLKMPRWKWQVLHGLPLGRYIEQEAAR